MTETERVAVAVDVKRLVQLMDGPAILQAVRMDLRTDNGGYTTEPCYSPDDWAEIKAIVAKYTEPA